MVEPVPEAGVNEIPICIGLIRRMPPQRLVQAITGVCHLVSSPEIEQELYQRVDLPLGNTKFKST
jgi:hypothetical protein